MSIRKHEVPKRCMFCKQTLKLKNRERPNQVCDECYKEMYAEEVESQK